MKSIVDSKNSYSYSAVAQVVPNSNNPYQAFPAKSNKSAYNYGENSSSKTKFQQQPPAQGLIKSAVFNSGSNQQANTNQNVYKDYLMNNQSTYSNTKIKGNTNSSKKNNGNQQLQKNLQNNDSNSYNNNENAGNSNDVHTGGGGPKLFMNTFSSGFNILGASNNTTENCINNNNSQKPRTNNQQQQQKLKFFDNKRISVEKIRQPQKQVDEEKLQFYSHDEVDNEEIDMKQQGKGQPFQFTLEFEGNYKKNNYGNSKNKNNTVTNNQQTSTSLGSTGESMNTVSQAGNFKGLQGGKVLAQEENSIIEQQKKLEDEEKSINATPTVDKGQVFTMEKKIYQITKKTNINKTQQQLIAPYNKNDNRSYSLDKNLEKEKKTQQIVQINKKSTKNVNNVFNLKHNNFFGQTQTNFYSNTNNNQQQTTKNAVNKKCLTVEDENQELNSNYFLVNNEKKVNANNENSTKNNTNAAKNNKIYMKTQEDKLNDLSITTEEKVNQFFQKIYKKPANTQQQQNQQQQQKSVQQEQYETNKVFQKYNNNQQNQQEKKTGNTNKEIKKQSVSQEKVVINNTINNNSCTNFINKKFSPQIQVKFNKNNQQNSFQINKNQSIEQNNNNGVAQTTKNTTAKTNFIVTEPEEKNSAKINKKPKVIIPKKLQQQQQQQLQNYAENNQENKIQVDLNNDKIAAYPNKKNKNNNQNQQNNQSNSGVSPTSQQQNQPPESSTSTANLYYSNQFQNYKNYQEAKINNFFQQQQQQEQNSTSNNTNQKQTQQQYFQQQEQNLENQQIDEKIQENIVQNEEQSAQFKKIPSKTNLNDSNQQQKSNSTKHAKTKDNFFKNTNVQYRDKDRPISQQAKLNNKSMNDNTSQINKSHSIDTKEQQQQKQQNSVQRGASLGRNNNNNKNVKDFNVSTNIIQSISKNVAEIKDKLKTYKVKTNTIKNNNNQTTNNANQNFASRTTENFYSNKNIKGKLKGNLYGKKQNQQQQQQQNMATTQENFNKQGQQKKISNNNNENSNQKQKQQPKLQSQQQSQPELVPVVDEQVSIKEENKNQNNQINQQPSQRSMQRQDSLDNFVTKVSPHQMFPVRIQKQIDQQESVISEEQPSNQKQQKPQQQLKLQEQQQQQQQQVLQRNQTQRQLQQQQKYNVAYPKKQQQNQQQNVNNNKNKQNISKNTEKNNNNAQNENQFESAGDSKVIKYEQKVKEIFEHQKLLIHPQSNGGKYYCPKTNKQFTYYMSKLIQFHNYYDINDYFNQLYREHFLQSYQSIAFSKTLKPLDQKQLKEKQISLPRRPNHKNRKTVIFDLDETLIHCNESIDIAKDIVLQITFPTGEVVDAGINIRPWTIECLKELSEYFEIIVFTASHSCYANKVLDYIDPKQEYIHHRLYRENCVTTEEGIYIKDLRIFSDRNINDIVIIDNAVYSFGYQIDSGIPIIPFYDNKQDEELKNLVPYLKHMIANDIQEINKATFKLQIYNQFNSPDELLQELAQIDF